MILGQGIEESARRIQRHVGAIETHCEEEGFCVSLANLLNGPRGIGMILKALVPVGLRTEIPKTTRALRSLGNDACIVFVALTGNGADGLEIIGGMPESW